MRKSLISFPATTDRISAQVPNEKKVCRTVGFGDSIFRNFSAWRFLVVVNLVFMLPFSGLAQGHSDNGTHGGPGGAPMKPLHRSPFERNEGASEAANRPPKPLMRSEQALEHKRLANLGRSQPTTKTILRIGSDGRIERVLPATPLGPVAEPASGYSGTASLDNLVQAPFLGGSFQGMLSAADPPDDGVAAGPNTVVSVTNSGVNTFDKTGRLLFTSGLAGFFGGLVAPGDLVFDPSVVFDPYIHRFWLLAGDLNNTNNTSSFLLAFSDSDDASADWSMVSLNARLNGSSDSGLGCDYPKIGFDAQAIYLTCNMFNFPLGRGGASCSFGSIFCWSNKVRVMTKEQFISGGCCFWWDFFALGEGFLNQAPSFAIQPARMIGANSANGEFLVNAHGGGGGDHVLLVRQILNAQNCCVPGNQTSPDIQQNDQGVGSFDTPPSAPQPPDSSGITHDIDTGDTRLLYAIWRNGKLATGQDLSCPDGNFFEACVAFTEIDVSAYPNMTTVNDFALSSSQVYRYYPAVDTNDAGNRTMVFTRSSTSEFPDVIDVGIPDPSVCTNCIDTESVVQAGSAPYTDGGTNNWGDYSAAERDPDGVGIWIQGQFAPSLASSGVIGLQVGLTQESSSVFVYPPNDAFANATLITTNNFTDSRDIFMATADSGDPQPPCFGGARTIKSVWYEFIPAASGNVQVDTLGSDHDTVISAYTQDFTGQLNNVGCSMPSSLATNSGFTVQAGAFQALFFMVNSAEDNVSTRLTFNLNFKVGTNLVLTSSVNPSVFGQQVTFTASVIAAQGSVPNGELVTLMAGSSLLGTAVLSNGTATLSLSSLPVGSDTINTSYAGDGQFVGSTGSLTQVVGKAASTTSLTTSMNFSIYGQPLSFRATVATQFGTPAGQNVTFYDGATAIGAVPLVANVAVFSANLLNAGIHLISATYNGDGNTLGSSSNAVTQVVFVATTGTFVVSTPDPSSAGQNVTITATVTPQFAGVPIPGTVTFSSHGTVLATVNVSNGTASLITNTLHKGSHPILAAYSGTSNLLQSSGSVQQKVGP